MTDLFPILERHEATIPAQATAGTDQATSILEVLFAGTVSAVYFLPSTALTASASVYRTFTLSNRKTDGSTGAVTVATLVTDVAGADWVAYDRKNYTLTATAANLIVAAGDVLAVIETHASTGTAHGGGRIVVEITRS